MSEPANPHSDQQPQAAGRAPADAPTLELAAAELRAEPVIGAEALVRASEEARTEALLGQERALEALRLGAGIGTPGYNVFVSGLRGRQERESVLALLREKAAAMTTPGDWVYVYNFRQPESPLAIRLGAGQGAALRQAMRDLVEFVVEQLPKAFRREEFERERAALRDKYNQRAQELFANLETQARQRGFAVRTLAGGQIIAVPVVAGRVPQSPEDLSRELEALPEAEQARIGRAQLELQEELARLVVRQQEMMRELVADVRAIERAFAARAVGPAIQELKGRLAGPSIESYLDRVQENILDNLDRFRQELDARAGEGGAAGPVAPRPPRFVEYEVNLLVDNSAPKGAPVIWEDAPSYRNLFGTIERKVDAFGRVSTDFTQIMAGSFLRAAGGFLVLDLDDALVEPGVWKTLKRALKTGRLTLETYEPISFFAPAGLKPEPIEVTTKVIALGSNYVYNLLYFYDPDFAGLWKVKAEIRPVVDLHDEAILHYAACLGSLSRSEGLPGFEAEAIGRVVEYGMRLAGDRRRLLAVMEPIEDLGREAAFYARGEGASRVSAAHVDRALAERILRLNFIEEEIRRLVADQVLVVELEGRRVGQVNGLAVLDVGGYSFGRPSRVTAAVALGQAGVINIEREVRLSGSTHDKGVMILSGFLRGRFGQELPAAMTASICFEQSYSGIDGDSASSAELYALLSALSGLPLRQDLAVTGSIDQHGRVQAIGGVNEKIEGFYRVCKAVGLGGTQGVLIPRANVAHLMLDRETAEAVSKGLFHVYAVDHVDQGIELLSGVPAGTPAQAGTMNYLVARRFREISDVLRDRPQGESRMVSASAAGPMPPGPPAPPRPPARGPGGAPPADASG